MKGCWYGSSNVHEDVPKLIDLYKEGKLKLEELVSREIGVDGVNEAFARDAARARSPARSSATDPQDRSLTSGGTPGVDAGSDAAGRTAAPWPCAWWGPGGRAREGAVWTVPVRMWELVARVS